MAALKVLMMGGRRCGKTSALASLFSQMTNGRVRDYFTVADTTKLETKGLEKQDALNDKLLELQYFLETYNEGTPTFLVDKTPTSHYWTYTLRLQIPGKRREMDIEFRDSAGEFFEGSSMHAQETADYIKDCDVFVIVIDTPYLMGCTEEESRNICPESINLGTNRVMDIQNFLTNINDNEGKDAKMVVFVPLKCEKWAKEPGGLNRVTERVKEVYATHITNLSAFAKMYISIIPMQTSGNILFSEFRKAYKYKSLEEGKEIRCCKISDKIVRNEDGTNHMLKSEEKLQEDGEAVIVGTNLLRPYSWYRINPKNHDFSPENCEQLPLHIIRFLLAKLIDAETTVKKTGMLGWLEKLLKRIRMIIGTMDAGELKSKIIQMQRDGIIKDNGDGIEIIKRF